ncbi:hypothetical protein Bbelb_165210 [Branchiostoma belcheri]|nr:hypothetical protein Bbelb_165210 [Branchiostoma belcheri]
MVTPWIPSQLTLPFWPCLSLLSGSYHKGAKDDLMRKNVASRWSDLGPKSHSATMEIESPEPANLVRYDVIRIERAFDMGYPRGGKSTRKIDDGHRKPSRPLPTKGAGAVYKLTHTDTTNKTKMADCVPVKFALRGKTSGDVVVLGSWDRWSQPIKLEKSTETLEDSTWINLPSGYYEYKFKINDSWIHDKTKPTVLNKFKTLNNFVNVVKRPDIVVSDTSDQAKKPCNITDSTEKQESSQDAREPLIPNLDIVASTDHQEGNADHVHKVDTDEGIDGKVEPQIEHVVDVPQESRVHVEPVSYVDIKPSESCQQNIEEKEVNLQEEPPVNVDKPKLEDEEGKNVVQDTTEPEGDKVNTERQFQQEVADYLAKEENLALAKSIPEETTLQEGDVSKAVQDNTDNVEVLKETAPNEDTTGAPVTMDRLDETFVKVQPVEEAYGSTGVDIFERDTSTEEEKGSTVIHDNQNRAEIASDETHIQEDTLVDEVKQEKEEENAAIQEATTTGGDQVITERQLQQDVAKYLKKEDKNHRETVTDNHEGEINRAVPDSIVNVADDTSDEKIVPQKDHRDVLKPDKNINETSPQKHAIESLGKEADKPVLEDKHSQDEKPVSDVQKKTEILFSQKTEKDGKIIQEIPKIKADKKEAPEKDETTLQPEEHNAAIAFDEAALPKEAANNVVTMVDSVVEEITKTAIQEAGKDVGKTSPQQRTAESTAVDDMKETTKNKLTESSAKPDVGKKALLEEFNKTDVDKVIAGDTAKQPSQEPVDSIAQDNLKVEIQTTSQEGKADVTPNETESEKENAGKDVVDELKKSVTEVAPFEEETIREKRKEEEAIIDAGRATTIKLDATTSVPGSVSGTTEPEETSNAPDKTTTKVESRQDDVVVPYNIHKEEALPEEDGAKDAESNLVKGMETPPEQVTHEKKSTKDEANKEIPLEDDKHEPLLPKVTKKEQDLKDTEERESKKEDTEVLVTEDADAKVNLAAEAQKKPETQATLDLTEDTKSEKEQKPTPKVEESPTPKVEEEEEKPTPEVEEKPTLKEEERPSPIIEEKPTPKEEERPTPKVAEKPTPKVEEKPTPKEVEKPASKEGEEKSAPKEEEKPTPMEEETLTPKKETTTPKVEEKPTPKEEEKSTPKVEEKPTSKEEEKPTPKVEEKPTPDEKKPTPKVEEKPTSTQQEKPTPKVEEKPTPNEEEKPTPKVEEKPTPKVEEKPAPKEEEKPAPKVEEKPTPKAEKLTPKVEEKPTPKEEEMPTPTEEEKPTPKAEEKPAPKVEEKPTPKEEKPTPKEEKPTPKEEEKPTPREEKPAPKEEEMPTPKEEKPTPKEEEKPTPKEETHTPKEKPTPKEEKPTPKEDENPTPKEEKPTPKEEERPIPKEEKPAPKEKIATEIVQKPTPKVEEEKPTPNEEKPAPKVVKATPITKTVQKPTPKVKEKPTPKVEETPTTEKVEKPKSEKLSTEKPKTPATPESTDDTKTKEGPMSRLAFWKKRKEEKPTPKKEEEPTTEKKSEPKIEQSTTEEPTTEKSEAKRSDDDTKPQGFLGLLRCCRCF